MIVYKTGVIINIIKFKKITLYVDCESSIFLGNIKANEIGIYLPSDEILLNKFEIGIYLPSDEILLNKFNAMNWDVVTDNLIHIKFLIKYSPILSKLIDNDELESIEIEKIFDDQCFNEIKFSNFIELNNGLSFPINALTFSVKDKKILIDNIFEQFLKIEKILK